VKLRDSLLWPLALPYGAATRLRALAYAKGILPRRRLPGVVISVGNLTVGGTGKTPMVLWVAERLTAEGKNAAILTRGYRGREQGGERNSGDTPLTLLSDEVQIMRARLGDRVAFGVGADRFARGRELAQRGVEWFILDDGFQHLQLARDVDIVLVDATNPFGGGRLLPSGRLREPRRALARADIIVITRSSHAPAVDAAIRRDSGAPVFYARAHLDLVRTLREGYPGAEDGKARGRKLFAFCGIGNPSAFLADLRDWGFQIAGYKFFPDHHRYRQQDVQDIQREAGRAGAEGAICTEKDIFNLADIRWGESGLWYCRISMRPDRGEELWSAIVAVAQSRA
jgi:tetraacyldisaccharide 4'-kinase